MNRTFVTGCAGFIVEALQFDPRSHDALNNLGWTLGELGFFDEARRTLQRALHLRPGWDLAQNNLKAVESHAR